MLYKYFLSKKGFTMMEILICVLVLGILVGVAVPIFSNVIKIRRRQDCKNQRTVIEGLVSEAMTGMMDNGKKQPKIYFDKVQADHKTTYPTTEGDGDNAYEGKECFILAPTGNGKVAFTLGDLRGGYRPLQYDDYSEGFDYGYFLKKEKLKNVMFYTYCVNHEPPICPFSEDGDPKYYYIFEDGTVLCEHEYCHDEV